MENLLKSYIGKQLRIYTISGVESYLGTLEEVHPNYIVMKESFSKERFYINMATIESFKEAVERKG